MENLEEFGDIEWNYRVLRHFDEDTGEQIFTIHEVFYDENDNPISCTEDPVAVRGDTMGMVEEEMKHYVEALKKPVLEYEDFESSVGS